MRLLLALLITATFALADDWTGKSIKPKEAVKLGRKVGNGIARDGAEVDTKKSYVVKSDDGTLLELADGYIFKFEAELGKEPDLPKAKAKDTDAAKDKGEWFGKKVLPKRSPDTIQMGDYDKDEKPYYWTPHNLGNCIVREDKGGFLRLYDGRREGWVKKEDMVTAEDAPAWWDQEVKKNPNDFYGWAMRGVSWRAKKEYDNAIKDLTEAIRLKPDSSASYNSRGLAWADKKEYDKAIADYTEAIRLDPKNASAYNNRGSAWHHKKEYDKAIADYTEAIRLDPKDANAYYSRGNSWRNKKDYDKAIADYTEAIRLDPKDANAYYSRGNSWRNKKDYDKAIADYTEAIRLDPKDAYAYNSRGNSWRNKKEYDKAIADYTEVLNVDPKSVSAINSLAWLHATSNDAKFRDGKKAVEYGKKAVELNPTRNNHDTLGAAYAEAGDFDMAVKTQQKAIEMLKAEKEFDKDELKKSEARLQLYRDKKPYRDE